jgi:hypothetical protein
LIVLFKCKKIKVNLKGVFLSLLYLAVQSAVQNAVQSAAQNAVEDAAVK